MKLSLKIIVILSIIGIFLVQIPQTPHAAFARRLNYQGRLTDSNGVPLASGNYDMVFSIYDASSGGTLIWTETHNGGTAQVSITNGLFSVVLGSYSSLNAVDFNGTEYWIEVAVSGTTYSPRKRLTATSNAINADLLDGNDSTFFQQRVTGTCGAGSSIRIINADGTVTCQTDVGVTAHGSLSGLGSDDHPQYFALAQNETVSGRPSFDGGDVTNPPFYVDSTIVVANLNADMLDGVHESSFFQLAQNETVTGIPAFDGGLTGTSAPFSVDSTYIVTNLNADYLDGYHAADLEAVLDHGQLQGLGDDDHPQYFALSQNETVSGIPAFNGGTSGSSAPFSVDSTYVVTNLNADMLDGYHYTSFILDGCSDCLNATEIEDIYVLTVGDTMTGNLSIDYAGNSGIELRANSGGTPYLDFSNDAASDYDGRIILTGNDSLTFDGTDIYIPNTYGIYMGGNTLGSDAARLYTGASDRIFVRAEDTNNVAQFADYGLYLPSPNGSTYNLYTGNGIQTAYSAAANIDWRNGGNITTNSGTYTPISFSSTSGYAHYGNGSGITLGDKPVYLRGSYGSDPNHGMIYNSTIDGPEFRAFSGFIWKNGASGATERMRLTSDGVLVPYNLAARYVETVMGPDTGADNQTHTVTCSAGYALVNFAVYASNYWDGNITLTCMYLGNLLNTGDNVWQDTTLETCDSCWHYATCGAGRVATGFRAYATGRIDYNLQFYCTDLNTSSYTSMANWMTSGNNDEANDDSMQGASCPAGTFMYAMAVYAGSYPDGDMRILCRGLIP